MSDSEADGRSWSCSSRSESESAEDEKVSASGWPQRSPTVLRDIYLRQMDELSVAHVWSGCVLHSVTDCELASIGRCLSSRGMWRCIISVMSADMSAVVKVGDGQSTKHIGTVLQTATKVESRGWKDGCGPEQNSRWDSKERCSLLNILEVLFVVFCLPHWIKWLFVEDVNSCLLKANYAEMQHCVKLSLLLHRAFW
jgi:hypothetical protein